MIMHVGILEQTSINVCVSGFVIVSRVKGRVVSEVLRKYDVCVKWDNDSDTTTPKHKSTNPEYGIFCAYIGPETET